MRRLLNFLYIFTEDAYLTLDGKNIVVLKEKKELGRVPLHTLEGIVCFSYSGASPSLMGACAERGISLSFFSPRGRYLAGVHGKQRGNVLLRKEQYRLSDDVNRSLSIAQNFITGKLYNSKQVLERLLRDHSLRINEAAVKDASNSLRDSLRCVKNCNSADKLRGIEGDAASVYFGVFNELVLRDKEFFLFEGRTRRPPKDAINAMLSLFYTVLANDCAAALEGVGLDPYVGFLHTDRPGRASLALDLMEELRSVCVDRFVLTAINNRVVDSSCFIVLETGECRLSGEARKNLFSMWQDRKRKTIVHPFLEEKIPWGLIPHVQALLLSRFVRGELDGYPPFLWK